MLKRYAPLLLIAYAGCIAPMPSQPAGEEQDGVAVKFQKASAAILLNDYAEKTGSRIEIVIGLDIHRQEIELKSDKPLSMKQYLAAVENKLKEHNIGLYPIGSNRIVATWIDPSIAPPPSPAAGGSAASYIERMRARRAQLMNRPIEAPQQKSTDLEEKLREYNMKLLKDARSFDSPTNAPEQKEGLDTVEMPLPEETRPDSTATNVVIEAEKGKLVEALQDAVGVPPGETQNSGQDKP